MSGLDHAGMVTLTAVLKDSSTLYAQCVVEPIIAAAAFGKRAMEGRMDQFLESVSNLFSSGSASAIFAKGDAGEFAASFLPM